MITLYILLGFHGTTFIERLFVWQVYRTLKRCSIERGKGAIVFKRGDSVYMTVWQEGRCSINAPVPISKTANGLLLKILPNFLHKRFI